MSSSTEISAQGVVVPGIEGLNKAREFTLNLAKDVEPGQMCVRSSPGANHAAYVLGHIAWTDDAFISMLGGGPSKLPEGWAEKFGYSLEITDNTSDYPGKDEMLKVMRERREALIEWLGSLSEAELLKPIEGDFAGFARTLAALPSTLAFHEGFHAGQLSACRRALGIERMF